MLRRNIRNECLSSIGAQERLATHIQSTRSALERWDAKNGYPARSADSDQWVRKLQDVAVRIIPDGPLSGIRAIELETRLVLDLLELRGSLVPVKGTNPLDFLRRLAIQLGVVGSLLLGGGLTRAERGKSDERDVPRRYHSRELRPLAPSTRHRQPALLPAHLELFEKIVRRSRTEGAKRYRFKKRGRRLQQISIARKSASLVQRGRAPKSSPRRSRHRQCRECPRRPSRAATLIYTALNGDEYCMHAQAAICATEWHQVSSITAVAEPNGRDSSARARDLSR